MNSLRPSAWPDLKVRYLLLLALGILDTCLVWYPPLWISYDANAGTVTSFGIVHHTNDISDEAFGDFYYQIYYAGLALIDGTCAAAAVSIYGIRRLARSAFSIHPLRLFNYAVGCFMFALGGSYLSYWLGLYSGDPGTPYPQHTVEILCRALITPIAEEIFFRLTLFQMLRSVSDFVPAAALSSIAFGLSHFGYPDHVKILMAAFFGMVTCWAYEKTGSILTPIAIHVLTNTWAQFI